MAKNSELESYIQGHIRRGTSVDKVRQKLLSAGWYASDVEEALSAVSQQPAMAKAIANRPKKKKRLAILSIILVVVIVGTFLAVREIGRCPEKWSCGQWSMCQDGAQARVCTEFTKCGTVRERPALTQPCPGPSATTSTVKPK